MKPILSLMDRIILRIFGAAGRTAARYRYLSHLQPFIRYMSQFRYRAENVDFDLGTSGERHVLELIAAQSPAPQVLFDVGANKGEWSRLAGSLMPAATIHAFEVVPETAALLTTALSVLPQARVNDFGLSMEKDEIVIYSHAEIGDSSATAFPIGGASASGYSVEHRGRVRRGDEYMRACGIETVDFLKIDVEGMDLHVLKGFGELLRAVKVIQFEYGAFNIQSRALLKDFFDLLKPFGFKIGKVYPLGVEFFDYRFTRENFMGNNYVAVRQDGSGTAELLAGRFPNLGHEILE